MAGDTDRGDGDAATAVDLFLKRQFETWDEACQKFADANNFVWSTDTSNTIKKENEKLAARGLPLTEFYKPELKYKNITLTCSFGGKKRTGKGQGFRAVQQSFKSGCPVEIHLIAAKNFLYIHSLNLTGHNHICDSEAFEVLPKIRKRKLEEPTVQEKVQLLFKGKVTPLLIRKIVAGVGTGGGVITSRDLQNYKQKLKRENAGGMSPTEKLTDALMKLMEADVGLSLHIEREADDMVYLFIQTSSMKATVEKFGKVVLVDHTYKINKNRMPVTVIMTMDGHGKVRPVGFAFIANEKATTAKGVMAAFVNSVGKETAEKIETVIVDKDYTEIAAIKEVLPGVNIQLCDFHASKTFNSRACKEPQEVKKILKELRYCSDEKEFEKLAQDLKAKCSEQFWEYFELNWLSCPVAWSYRDKKVSPNYGNNTNNRLENLNSKIKIILDANKELHEAIEGLLDLVKTKEEDASFTSIYESLKETYITTQDERCDTETANKMLKDLTRFCAKLLIYEMCEMPSAEESCNTFHPTAERCSCPHWFMYLLPCRHILYMRKAEGLPVYDKNMIDSMWWKENNKVAVKTPASEPTARPSSPVVFSYKVPSQLRPKTSAQKFSQSLLKANELCAVMSESGDEQYQEKYCVLKDVLRIWCNGKEVLVIEKSDNPAESSEIPIVVTSAAPEVPVVVTSAVPQAPVVLASAASEVPVVLTSTVSEVPVVVTSAVSEVSAVVSVIPETTSSVVSLPSQQAAPEPPECFCRKPTVRRRCLATVGRMAGRIFDVSPDSVCKFRRLAKKFPETNIEQPTPINSSPVSETHDQSTLLDDGDDEVLAQLRVDEDNSSVSDSVSKAVATLKEAMEGIKIPQSAKHKGRPRNVGKTFQQRFSKPSKISKIPKGAVNPPEKDEAADRRDRAKQIPDQHVTETNSGWCVKSQGKGMIDRLT